MKNPSCRKDGDPGDSERRKRGSCDGGSWGRASWNYDPALAEQPAIPFSATLRDNQASHQAGFRVLAQLASGRTNPSYTIYGRRGRVVYLPFLLSAEQGLDWGIFFQSYLLNPKGKLWRSWGAGFSIIIPVFKVYVAYNSILGNMPFTRTTGSHSYPVLYLSEYSLLLPP
ncbi:hypothetical protein B9Z19DRAFT_1063491 [Tuber borchii]|uniref:Uncharacterized protein n=1 Tax=Tuber borchii TaxID=42251 RepID=A0A2T6ZY51_TUBBO|nr:hypothetical protein B9Z19DRAFT_1063491 [Tuber borchii]